MSHQAPSSATRSGPAILVLTGAAAAFAAYIIYTNFQGAPPEGLHRSSSVRRRGNNRTLRGSPTAQQARSLEEVLPEAFRSSAGQFDFFGHPLLITPYDVIPATQLREIAREHEPTATEEIVDDRIKLYYRIIYNTVLREAYADRIVSQDDMLRILDLTLPGPNPSYAQLSESLGSAVEEHNASLNENQLTHRTGYHEDTMSIPPTEVGDNDDDESQQGDGQLLQHTLFHIAEDRARQEGVMHRGVTCDACDVKPIRGVRWRCANCPDYDLCSDCEATNTHNKTHIFYKIKVPAPYLNLAKQEPIYPGRPDQMTHYVNSTIKKRLAQRTTLEVEEIEALWDQFTCLAGTKWESDPNKIGWALDRRGFDQAFKPRYSTFVSAPNLIYDRIFAYYDTDRNGLIGFEEFVNGLDGMHCRDQKVKHQIIFNGYDIDGDGYISRKDVLRIFRAYYAMEKEATHNYIMEATEELTVRGALDVIRSSQPLGSAFTQNNIPSRNSPDGPPPEKTRHGEEDMPPVVRGDTDDTLSRADAIRQTLAHDPRQSDVDEALRQRWERRQFYIDEEEGFTRPEGVPEDPPPVPNPNSHPSESEAVEDDNVSSPAPEQERPRGSRSSSRVRFQDEVDMDFDTRSNASTSSRPFGERWGGYEIPEPEKDLGREVMYQITQQGFNELLNPLFLAKEEQAMTVLATRAARLRLADSVGDMLALFEKERENNAYIYHIGFYKYAKKVMRLPNEPARDLYDDEDKNFKTPRELIAQFLGLKFDVAEEAVLAEAPHSEDQSDRIKDSQLWDVFLCRLQLKYEFVWTVVQRLEELGWFELKKTVPEYTQSPSKTRPKGWDVEGSTESPQLDGTNGFSALQADAEESQHEGSNRDSNMDSTIANPSISSSSDPTMPQFRPNSFATRLSVALHQGDRTARVQEDLAALPDAVSDADDDDWKSENEVDTGNPRDDEIEKASLRGFYLVFPQAARSMFELGPPPPRPLQSPNNRWTQMSDARGTDGQADAGPSTDLNGSVLAVQSETESGHENGYANENEGRNDSRLTPHQLHREELRRALAQRQASNVPKPQGSPPPAVDDNVAAVFFVETRINTPSPSSDAPKTFTMIPSYVRTIFASRDSFEPPGRADFAKLVESVRQDAWNYAVQKPSSIPKKRDERALKAHVYDVHIALLASYESMQKDIDAHGPGKLSYVEFEEIMRSKKNLRFLESWVEWASF